MSALKRLTGGLSRLVHLCYTYAMRITSLEPQLHHPDRFNLFLDEEFALGISADLMLSLQLHINQELSPAELAEIKEGESGSGPLSGPSIISPSARVARRRCGGICGRRRRHLI